MIREIWARIRSYGGRSAAEREMRQEIEAHLRIAAADYVRRGLSEDDARRAARRDFGSVEATKERYRDQLGLPTVDALGQDLRTGWRQLRKSPAFAVTACLLLAIGIGAATAVYSVVDAILVSPLPGMDPERRLAINETAGGRPTGGSVARRIDMHESVGAFTAVAGYYGEDAVLTGDGDPRRVPVLRTFGPYLEVLGLAPVIGRPFSVAEEDGLSDAVALVSDAFWRRELGAEVAALGRTIQLSGAPVTIVGVMPRETFPRDIDLFIPADRSFQELGRGARFLGLAARLQPGVTIEQAQAEVDQLMAALQQEYPDTDEDVGAILSPLQSNIVGDARTPLVALFATTLTVLLLTCLNLAGLMLARGLRRRSEVAVRVALGASAGRVIRLFVVEGMLIAVGGGTLGLLVASAGTDLLGRWVATATSLAGPLAVDWRVAGIGLLLATMSGLILGAVPAWQATRRDAAPALREGRVAMGVGSSRLRRVLVGGQIALSIMLLIAAALLTREFVHHVNKPLGFEPEQVLTVKTRFSWGTPSQRVHEFSRLALERLATVPGVRSVGLTDRLPFEGASQSSSIVVRGRDLDGGLAQQRVARRAVSIDYLRTIGVPLLAGEPLRRLAAPLPADGDLGTDMLVNQALAEAFFPGTDPVGEFISFAGGAGDRDSAPRWHRIVGVVGDVRRELTEETVPPEAFGLYDDTGWPLLSFVVAGNSSDLSSLAGPVRAAIHEVAPEQVIDSIEPLTQRVELAAAGQRRNAWIMYGFAGLALALVMVGLYGLIAAEVAQRVPELGIRAALGARSRHIVLEATRHTLVTAVIGTVTGVIGGGLAAIWLRDALTAVEPLDPVAIAAALGGMALAAAAAALPAVRRALRIDPARALRQE